MKDKESLRNYSTCKEIRQPSEIRYPGLDPECGKIASKDILGTITEI